jgi:hypothetical protein
LIPISAGDTKSFRPTATIQGRNIGADALCHAPSNTLAISRRAPSPAGTDAIALRKRCFATA